MTLKDYSSSELFNLLKKNILINRSQYSPEDIYHQLHQRLTKKFELLSITQSIVRSMILWLPDQFDLGVVDNLELLKQYASDLGINIFARSIDMVYGYHEVSGIEGRLFNDGWIPVVSEEDRIIFRNKYVTKKQNIQVWQHPSVIPAYEYNKHSQNSRNLNASKYSMNLNDRKYLELTVFNQGYGIINSKKQLLIFGRSDVVVGKTTKGKTNIVKIFVTREKDTFQLQSGFKTTGYVSRIHGHPYLEAELKKYYSNIYEKVMDSKLNL